VIRACIFDLDGVIVDTAHYHFLAWQRLGAELGINLTEADNERLKGVSRMQSLEIILSLGQKTLPRERMEQLANRKNKWFVEYVEAMKQEEIFPGVKGLIDRMKARAFRIGLASSSKNAQRVVELLGVAGLFDTIVDGTMIAHSKPDPEIFLLAAKRMNIEPAACVVFEDAEAGVEAALRAGMKCVGVGSQAQLGKAHKVIQRTSDFNIDDLMALA
jgi:beta-phosphoglucomutase